ncbi:MAG TPA: PAS domain-containing sensor histidine kinase [Kofleriaceae bacterium]
MDPAFDRLAMGEPELRRLVDAIPHLVWSMNADASDAYMNPRWREYTGQAASLSLHDAWLAAIHPDDRDACFASWAQARASRTPWQVEYRLRRHDGQYRWHLGRGVPHCDASGEIVRWYGTATDVHEQHNAMRARADLVATVGHDLRGPMSAILLAAESLEESCPERREIGVIQRAITKMERLVRDLLDISNIESGKLSVSPAPCAIDAMIEEAVETVRRAADAKGLVIDTALSAPPVRVQGDRGRIIQVLGNLLTNSVKHTPAAGRISIRVEADGPMVRIAVVDTGPGLEPAQLPRVFDRFWRARDTAKAGTGLGLAICKGIVEQHGGSIGVDSEPGRGATFWFTLLRANDHR